MTEKKDRTPTRDTTPKAQDEASRELSIDDVETEDGEDVKGGGCVMFQGSTPDNGSQINWGGSGTS